ncbi:TetR/AcrR family transcriptional regulator [uncultured Microbacterium sp.]|uniref:TetR/AcrR family transcriptional regulator n=1 Tax=uncultured Microbacterium sp. TaxID=191216 RepID=UPI0035CC2390
MDDTVDEIDLPRGVALAWGVAADPQRGPKREMSVEKIVDAAVEIADADGIAAVSMSAVAGRLGYTPMSLYRYVSAKEDLVLLMSEAASGLPPESLREIDGWRARLVGYFDAQVSLYLRHPWILDIPISGSPTTPNSAAWMDAALEALDETPLDEQERMAVVLLVTGHTRWYGTILASYARITRDTGLSPSEIAEREAGLYDALIQADDYPALYRASRAGVFRSRADPFRFGFERILDGVAAYIDTAPADRAAADTTWAADETADVAGDKKYREAQKVVHAAERALRAAHRAERQVLREARERAAHRTP